jgi:DNA polymerase-1
MKKDRLLSILSSLKEEDVPLHSHINSKILLVDGMNTFLRSFAVDNKFNRNGHHIGGVAGFLKSIGYAIKNESPSRVIIIFDGEGGSVNRKYLYPEYKANRNTGRLVNKMFQDKDEEEDAKINEIERLIDYLNYLPLTTIAVDRLEADDVVGYTAKKFYNDYSDSTICIMSTDNDYLQLVNDRIYCYSPTKKKHYYEKEVFEEFGVYPWNYLLYKCFLGDTSDNVKGIYGLGEKKLVKLFPIMSSKSELSFDDIYEICEEPPKKSVLYNRVLEGKRTLFINEQIMNLSKPNISEKQLEFIDSVVEVNPPRLRKQDFLSLYRQDGMEGTIMGIDSWLETFSVLNRY